MTTVPIQDIGSRISAIQAQLASLSGSTVSSALSSTQAGDGSTGTASSTASDFSAALGRALTTSSGSTATTSGQQVVADAQRYLGIPYVWGGTNPATGLDCSGLTQRVYADLGVTLPRTAAEQQQVGTPVASLADAQPGDLLFFGDPAHHVAIYAGDGHLIEAPHTGEDVHEVGVYATPTSIRRITGSSLDPGATVSNAVATAPAASPSARVSTPYAADFQAASARTGVPVGMLTAVAQQESGFDAAAVSPAGARGLMQLMPGTASSLGVTDALDPAQSINGAANSPSRVLR